MESLIHIIQELSKTRRLSEIVEIVRKAARAATGADGATFVLKDENFCFYVDEDAIGPLWKGKRFPLSACISGWSMIHKQSVVIPDIYQDSRIPVDAYRPTFVKSLVMVPIRSEDPIGAIGNYWAYPHTATPHELEVLQALAATTSVAIENVHLYGSLQDRVSELEAANRAKDEFLLIVSHELRTPLNAIMGWSDILTSYECDPQEQKEGLAAIHRSAKAQCRVVDSLLDTSSIVLGKFHVQSGDVDFVAIVGDVVGEMRPFAASKSVEFSFSSLMDEAHVAGDGDRLRKAVYNLVENAVKFTPTQGEVWVELKREGPSVKLEVCDSGRGLDMSSGADIFHQFSQSEGHLTRRFGGLGLGLVVTKSIVEAHKGRVTVASDGIGRGSRFSITLPLVVEVHESRSSPTASSLC